MLKIKEYVKVSSLEQAYELNQKRTNRIIGGMLWMKMGKERIHTAIDLSGLGLDTIEETEREFVIGCMVTLRQLELDGRLSKQGSGILGESVRNIVGVQFRNLATVGGSLFGRFGFSDVLTAFLALDAEVELYRGGRIPLAEFAAKGGAGDILVRVFVKKDDRRCIYLSHRNTKTDFPVLTVAVSSDKAGIRIVAGARPQRAVLVTEGEGMSPKETDGTQKVCAEKEPDEAGSAGTDPDSLAKDIYTGEAAAEAIGKYAAELAARIPTGSNMRASAAYRSHLAGVLIRRGLTALNEEAKRERGRKDAD